MCKVAPLKGCTANRYRRPAFHRTNGRDFLATSPSINGTTTIQSVIDRCGAEIASQIIDHFGGQILYIAKKPRGGSGLLKALDPADVQKLCKALGGETLLVPVGRNSAIRKMRQSVERMVREGLSTSEIARRAGCCRRTVYVVRSEMRASGEIQTEGRKS